MIGFSRKFLLCVDGYLFVVEIRVFKEYLISVDFLLQLI
jgi:hypothetical protein